MSEIASVAPLSEAAATVATTAGKSNASTVTSTVSDSASDDSQDYSDNGTTPENPSPSSSSPGEKIISSKGSSSSSSPNNDEHSVNVNKVVKSLAETERERCAKWTRLLAQRPTGGSEAEIKQWLLEVMAVSEPEVSKTNSGSALCEVLNPSAPFDVSASIVLAAAAAATAAAEAKTEEEENPTNSMDTGDDDDYNNQHHYDDDRRQPIRPLPQRGSWILKKRSAGSNSNSNNDHQSEISSLSGLGARSISSKKSNRPTELLLKAHSQQGSSLSSNGFTEGKPTKLSSSGSLRDKKDQGTR